MKCPFCNEEIEYVFCVSTYTQKQMIDKESGVLLGEWEDVNDAIGDALYNLCPHCSQELIFDNLGHLIQKG